MHRNISVHRCLGRCHVDPIGGRHSAVSSPFDFDSQFKARAHHFRRQAGYDARVNIKHARERPLADTVGFKEAFKMSHAPFVAQRAPFGKDHVARCAFAMGMAFGHSVHMNLARIREAKKLSQRDLAEMIGMDASTITRAERMAPTAKLETYKKCADALGVTLSDIFADPMTDLERTLLAMFRSIPEANRHRVVDFLEIARAAPPQEAGQSGQPDPQT